MRAVPYENYASGQGVHVRVRTCVYYIRVRMYTCAVELRALARACMDKLK